MLENSLFKDIDIAKYKDYYARSGDKNQFFGIIYLNLVGEKTYYEATNCHEIGKKYSTKLEKWEFIMINYHNEDQQERINIIKDLIVKTKKLFNLPMPEFTILSENLILVSSNSEKYKCSSKRLKLLKLMRFSYSYIGETIGQLFLSQRYMKTPYDFFVYSGNSNIISARPATFCLSTRSSNFLDSGLNRIINKIINNGINGINDWFKKT